MSQNYLSHDIWSCVGKPTQKTFKGSIKWNITWPVIAATLEVIKHFLEGFKL